MPSAICTFVLISHLLQQLVVRTYVQHILYVCVCMCVGMYSTYVCCVVYSAYIRPKLSPEDVCSAYALRLRLGAYALQTSEGRGFRVVYARNTPCNHDSCNIYVNCLVQRCHFLPSGVYAIYTTCASIGQWPPLVYIYLYTTITTTTAATTTPYTYIRKYVHAHVSLLWLHLLNENSLNVSA